MRTILQPWQLLFLSIAGWVHRDEHAANAYLRTENAVLREHLGKRRLLLSDEQRRRLAVKAKVLGRKLLAEVATLVTPDTLLRWHRQLVAQKWDMTARRQSKGGRPPVSVEVRELVLRLARENPTWGYDRVQGALANLGHQITDTTVGKILKAHGIEPAPQRKRQTSWLTFIRAHWDVLSAIDFTTIEVWTRQGLVTFYLLFAIEQRTRRVHFAGCTTTPDEIWMKPIALDLTNGEDGFLNGKRYILMDRDGKFCPSFQRILRDAGVEPVLLPPRSPNLNAHIERFFRSLKEECLERMIFFGEQSLRTAVQEFMAHYHGERNHQGLGNRLIEPGAEVGNGQGEVQCRERLGGLLHYYHRAAA